MKGILAGYISGSRVALARVKSDRGKIALDARQSYSARDYSDLDSILRHYLKKNPVADPAACFGVAGPVLDGQVSTTNLPWHIVASDIEQRFSFRRIALVNDIVATAHDLPQLSSEKLFSLNNGKSEISDGNIGLIAAGAGLGEALIFNDGHKFHPMASEGGHADFAPFNQIESELWEYVYSELGRVEVEDVLSAEGLERIFHFLVDIQGGGSSEWFDEAKDRPSAIIEQALSGEDETATRAMDLFIDCYASEAANLALTGMTTGGLYISGQIAPRIVTLLDNGRFMDRFVKQGKMESLLRSLPVGVIIEEDAPLLGAAGVAASLG